MTERVLSNSVSRSTPLDTVDMDVYSVDYSLLVTVIVCCTWL